MESTTSAYLVIVIERAPSSGAEQRSQAIFLSLEGAVEWLKKQHEAYAEDYYYPDEWDEEDFGCPFPESSMFTVDLLKENLATNEVAYYDKHIWGPYSEYQGQVPLEYFIKKVKIHP